MILSIHVMVGVSTRSFNQLELTHELLLEPQANSSYMYKRKFLYVASYC